MILESPVPTNQALGTPVRQFSVMLSNKAGALTSLLSMLGSYSIVCVGVSMVDTQEVSIARFIVSNPELTNALLLERGIGFSVTEMIVVALPYGASKLCYCLEALAQYNLNIDYLYPLFPLPKGYSMVALHCDDLPKARDILLMAGFKSLCQEDISR